MPPMPPIERPVPAPTAHDSSSPVRRLLADDGTDKSNPPDALPAPPFRLLASPPSHVIEARQTTQTATIPSFYGSIDASPTPGAVAGITLGAVGGFILLLWLVYTCINMGNPPENAESSVGSVIQERKRTSTHRHAQRRSRHGHEATVEIRHTTSRRGPAAVIIEDGGGPAVERVVMEETIRRSASHQRGPRIVPVDSDDEIVVLEEHRRPPRRHSRMRSVERRSGGYRDGDGPVIREARPPSSSRQSSSRRS